MWIIDSLKEKKRLRNEKCNDLINIVINSASYINGQMITTGYDEMNAYCNYVARVTGQRCRFYFDNKADYGRYRLTGEI